MSWAAVEGGIGLASAVFALAAVLFAGREFRLARASHAKEIEHRQRERFQAIALCLIDLMELGPPATDDSHAARKMDRKLMNQLRLRVLLGPGEDLPLARAIAVPPQIFFGTRPEALREVIEALDGSLPLADHVIIRPDGTVEPRESGSPAEATGT